MGPLEAKWPPSRVEWAEISESAIKLMSKDIALTVIIHTRVCQLHE